MIARPLQTDPRKRCDVPGANMACPRDMLRFVPRCACQRTTCTRVLMRLNQPHQPKRHAREGRREKATWCWQPWPPNQRTDPQNAWKYDSMRFFLLFFLSFPFFLTRRSLTCPGIGLQGGGAMGGERRKGSRLCGLRAPRGPTDRLTCRCLQWGWAVGSVSLIDSAQKVPCWKEWWHGSARRHLVCHRMRHWRQTRGPSRGMCPLAGGHRNIIGGLCATAAGRAVGCWGIGAPWGMSSSWKSPLLGGEGPGGHDWGRARLRQPAGRRQSINGPDEA